MNDDIVREFAKKEGLDADVVKNRWHGNPAQIAEDIFRIQDLDTGEYRDLELFRPIQTKVIDAYFYSNAKTFNLYKGRRIGYSFVVALCFLLDGMMNPNSVFPVVGIKQSGAESRIADIQDLIDNAKVEIPTEKDNNGEIVLWNGSKYIAYSGAPDSSRGDDSAKAVLLDEMAFYEDQEAVSRAFRAFIVLGNNRKMVQVSTPKVSNDLFMQTHREGDERGTNGTLSIKQPTFHNADEIDYEKSLFDQEVHPVRPDLDLQTVEEERSKDPKGFAQEYLCQPIDDSYAFFSEQSIIDAMDRNRTPPPGSYTVLACDIGIDKDDTVITVFEHSGEQRFQSHIEVVTDELLRDNGIENPDRGNANHVARRIHQVYRAMDVDYVVMDRTGPGETFQRIIERKIGRGIIGFNFSDKEAVEDMMGDMNNALRNDKVTLVDSERLFDEMSSIMKEQREDYVKPKFSGKDTSETGKDDTAIATVLGAFPPGLAVKPETGVKQKSTEQDIDTTEGSSTQVVVQDNTRPMTNTPNQGAFGATKAQRSRRGREKYKSRHRR